MEEADRIGIELFSFGLVAVDVRKSADAVKFQTPMKGGTGQLGNGGPERIEAVVQRQQRNVCGMLR